MLRTILVYTSISVASFIAALIVFFIVGMICAFCVWHGEPASFVYTSKDELFMFLMGIDVFLSAFVGGMLWEILKEIFV